MRRNRIRMSGRSTASTTSQPWKRSARPMATLAGRYRMAKSALGGDEISISLGGNVPDAETEARSEKSILRRGVSGGRDLVADADGYAGVSEDRNRGRPRSPGGKTTRPLSGFANGAGPSGPALEGPADVTDPSGSPGGPTGSALEPSGPVARSPGSITRLRGSTSAMLESTPVQPGSTAARRSSASSKAGAAGRSEGAGLRTSRARAR